jgi:beta-mannosidase
MGKLDLTGRWTLKAVRPGKSKQYDTELISKGLPADVPGTVHTDLIRNEVIPDPYYRMNERDVQWVDLLRWEYSRDLVVDRSMLESETVTLVAEGLDTFAAIYINGKKVGETDNMFIAYRFDLKQHLRSGKNRITVLFDSPEVRSRELERTHGPLLVALEPQRVYARKAQYSYGWDWGPKLTTSGIWRDIYIEYYHNAKIRDPFVKIVSLDENEAVVDISADIDRCTDDPLQFYIRIEDRDRIIESTVPADDGYACVRVVIPNPRRWYPNGYGEQELYIAVLELLSADNEVIDSSAVSFGLRTVALVRKPDHIGESFIIEVNGVPVFCKGANWIPADNFIPRIPDSRYETLLTRAREAHMNMIRVWGGGIYEQDIFYDLCDRLGLLVWQDFMFACGEYPEHDEFLAGVEREVRQNVKRLRNHPSVALWCGNNECEYLFCNGQPGCTPDDMKGATIFRNLLPKVCDETDGTRPYWRSSPFGTGHPNETANGNHHQWEVWSNWKDYREYSKTLPRFVTEFGFQGPADARTFEEVTEKRDRHFQSEVMEHHNKQVDGTERLYRFQASHYTIENDFATFIHRGQLVQAEALKHGVEHWRRNKFVTAGAVYWQLNDCWPVSSWSAIDSGLRAKAAYYFSKKFFNPVLVSFHDAGESIEVWVTNDTLREFRAHIQLVGRTFGGEVLYTKKIKTDIGANDSVCVLRLPRKKFSPYDPGTTYLYAGLSADGTIVTENRFFFNETKHLSLPVPKIVVRARRKNGHTYAVRLETDLFAKGVALSVDRVDAELSDNYFDLDPGVPYEVYVTLPRDIANLRERISVSSVR